MNIVDRLRDRAYSGKSIDRLLEEAADVIEALQDRVAAMQAVALANGMKRVASEHGTNEPTEGQAGRA